MTLFLSETRALSKLDIVVLLYIALKLLWAIIIALVQRHLSLRLKWFLSFALMSCESFVKLIQSNQLLKEIDGVGDHPCMSVRPSVVIVVCPSYSLPEFSVSNRFRRQHSSKLNDSFSIVCIYVRLIARSKTESLSLATSNSLLSFFLDIVSNLFREQCRKMTVQQWCRHHQIMMKNRIHRFTSNLDLCRTCRSIEIWVYR